MSTSSQQTKRLVLITGGSRGLGQELCQILSEPNSIVVEFSRSAPHEYSVEFDLANPMQMVTEISLRLAELAQQPWREIVVIHNAGVLDPMGAAGTQEATAIMGNLQSNLVGPILFLSEVLRVFSQEPVRKVLLNISSGAALKGFAGWSLYCAAKAGMEGHIRAIAQEQKTRSAPFIAVNVDPGVMDTAMQAAIRSATAEQFPLVDFFIERKEKGELLDPKTVAQAIQGLIETLETKDQGQRIRVADLLAP